MHKTAAEQPPGTARNIALWLTGGLADVTGAIGLDEPRSLVKAVLGRSNDDTVSAKITFRQVVIPVAGASRQRAAASRTSRKHVVALPTFSASKPLKLYMTGDSLITDPGSAFLDLAHQSGVIDELPPDPHSASGLAQPEIFNWFDYLPHQAHTLRPNLVVLTLGGNDGLTLSGSGGGEAFGTPGWRREYARRVGGVMDDFISYGAKIIWLGLPIPRDSDLAARYRVINQVARQQAQQRAGDVVYVDLYKRFEDSSGHYSDYLRGPDGQLVHVREPDGIHYDIAGAEIIAHLIARTIPLLVHLRTSDPDFRP
jgi:uncharacterized protein